MSEKQRAFQALAGNVFPHVGDRAVFSEGFERIDAEFEDDNERTVEVLRVSKSGKTIWTRFVHPDGYIRYGGGTEPQQWALGEGGYYWSNDPLGDLRFR